MITIGYWIVVALAPGIWFTWLGLFICLVLDWLGYEYNKRHAQDD